ncbi:MAG: hypothetical protein EOP56_15105 [Sphingobacteriales bacterium]|nr:MAG: hypothetical protein EOP56_15105 [Sphingobacteriales bacterium]
MLLQNRKISELEWQVVKAMRKAAKFPVNTIELDDEFITQAEFMKREGTKTRDQMRGIREKLMKVDRGLQWEGGEKLDSKNRTIRRNYRYNYTAYIKRFKTA